MCPHFLHLYGPIWINSYGTMLAIGFALFIYLLHKDKRRKQFISDSTLSNVLFIGLISGIIGGRIVAVIENFDQFKDNLIEIFYPWVGGLGVLGAIIGVLMSVSIYLKIKQIPIFSLFDRAAVYAPLIQAIGRIGCFLAGCCYGIPLSSKYIFAIKFTDPEGLAPLNVYLHPTQLYISAASLFMFLIMFFILQKIFIKPGQLIFSYLILESCSRFFIDFYRADRVFIFNDFSFFQLISVALFVFSIVELIYITLKGKYDSV